MTINVPADLEKVLVEEAARKNTTPEALAVTLLRDTFANHLPTLEELAQDEWGRKLLSIGVNCGVSLSNEALSSEGLYD